MSLLLLLLCDGGLGDGRSRPSSLAWLNSVETDGPTALASTMKRISSARRRDRSGSGSKINGFVVDLTACGKETDRERIDYGYDLASFFRCPLITFRVELVDVMAVVTWISLYTMSASFHQRT